MTYLVIDGFCSQADEVVESAMAAGFDTWLPKKGEVGSSIYQGMGFWGRHSLMLRALTGAMGCPVIPNSMFFRVTNIGTEQAYIHSDREAGNHTCIVYLSSHEDAYGTAFYRHRPTGMTEMPSFDDMRDEGIFDQLKLDMVSRGPDKWEQIDFVRGQYNRALIFNAPLFHSRIPLEGFGSDENDGRLVWASHFYKLSGNGDLT